MTFWRFQKGRFLVLTKSTRGVPRGTSLARNELAMESPQVGGTRGAAKDASERVKAQAIILYYKELARGQPKMAAAQYAADATNNCEKSVRNCG